MPINFGELKRVVTYTCTNCKKIVTEINPDIKHSDSFGSYGETIAFVVCPECSHEDEIMYMW